MGAEVDMSLLTLCVVVFSAMSKHVHTGSDAVFNTHAKYEVDVKAAALAGNKRLTHARMQARKAGT